MAREVQQLPGTIVDGIYTIHPTIVFVLPTNYPFSPPKLHIHS